MEKNEERKVNGDESSLTSFKAKDRVARTDGTGSRGTILSVRLDAVSPTGDRRDRGVRIAVQWDNGTFSYLDPNGLSLVDK